MLHSKLKVTVKIDRISTKYEEFIRGIHKNINIYSHLTPIPLNCII